MMDGIRKSMRQITRMAQSYTARAMQGCDLSPSQMQGLRIVCFHQGVSQQGLADHMGIDKAAVARLTTVLEQKGYILRGPDPRDGRVKRLTATQAGHALKDALIASETGFYEHIFEGMEAADLAVFQRVLGEAHRRAHAARAAGYAPLLPAPEEGEPCS